MGIIMRTLITVGIMSICGCAVVPAHAQPDQISEDLKRVEEEQRRTGEKVDTVRALIESDKLGGLESLLIDVLEEVEGFRRDFENERVAMATFKENLKTQVSDATGWSNYQSIGMAGGVGLLGAGGMVGRKRKNS